MSQRLIKNLCTFLPESPHLDLWRSFFRFRDENEWENCHFACFSLFFLIFQRHCKTFHPSKFFQLLPWFSFELASAFGDADTQSKRVGEKEEEREGERERRSKWCDWSAVGSISSLSRSPSTVDRTPWCFSAPCLPSTPPAPLTVEEEKKCL